MEVCVSLASPQVRACARAMAGLPMAEIRLDAMDSTAEQVRRLFGAPGIWIATCRPGRHSLDGRIRLLAAAIEGGAALVDLELDGPTRLKREIASLAQAAGCKLILSHHDFVRTPGRRRLLEIRRRCFALGADLAKIACLVRSAEDNARLLGLLAGRRRRQTVVVGMGPLGRITRLAAPLLGSPFTFASLATGQETAPGQLEHGQLRRLLGEVAGD